MAMDELPTESEILRRFASDLFTCYRHSIGAPDPVPYLSRLLSVLMTRIDILERPSVPTSGAKPAGGEGVGRFTPKVMDAITIGTAEAAAVMPRVREALALSPSSVDWVKPWGIDALCPKSACGQIIYAHTRATWEQHVSESTIVDPPSSVDSRACEHQHQDALARHVHPGKTTMLTQCRSCKIYLWDGLILEILR